MTYKECKNKYSNSHKILCDDGEYLIMYKIYGDDKYGNELELIKFDEGSDDKANIIMIVADEVKKLIEELTNNTNI